MIVAYAPVSKVSRLLAVSFLIVKASVSLVVAGLGLAGRIGVGCYCSWL